MELKLMGGHPVNVKQKTVNGVPIGIVEGYIATWDIDRGDWSYRDKFVKGCFEESIREYLNRKRMPRFKYMHRKTVGGWKYDSLKEDDKGLFGIAEINLDVEEGKEAYSLAKQNVLTDFSVGFDAEEFSTDEEKKIRTITKAYLWEGSIVDEPMNPHANITSVKTATPYSNLPLADVEMAWDSTAAVKRVRDFTESVESPSARYKKAFFWYDSENSDNFTAYKLPFADVVDGNLKAVPRAIFAAAAAMRGARGGVDIPDSERATVENNINKYYDKMGRESPLKEKSSLFIDVETIKIVDERVVEELLTMGNVKFSNNASKKLIGSIKSGFLRESEGIQSESEGEKMSIKLDKILKQLGG